MEIIYQWPVYLRVWAWTTRNRNQLNLDGTDDMRWGWFMDVEAVCSWVCGLESHCVSMCNPTFCKPLRPFASSLLESHLVSQERSTKHLLHTIMTRKDINRYIYMDRCGHLHFVFLLVWLVLWWELLVQRQRDVCSPTWLPDPMRSAELRFSWTLTGNGWEWMGMELLIEVHIHSFFKNQIGLYILGLFKFGFTKWLGFCIHFLLHSMALSWYLQNE